MSTREYGNMRVSQCGMSYLSGEGVDGPRKAAPPLSGPVFPRPPVYAIIMPTPPTIVSTPRGVKIGMHYASLCKNYANSLCQVNLLIIYKKSKFTII